MTTSYFAQTHTLAELATGEATLVSPAQRAQKIRRWNRLIEIYSRFDEDAIRAAHRKYLATREINPRR